MERISESNIEDAIEHGLKQMVRENTYLPVTLFTNTKQRQGIVGNLLNGLGVHVLHSVRDHPVQTI